MKTERRKTMEKTNNQPMRKRLAETIKGMRVKKWEERKYSSGYHAVYVHFIPKEPVVTVNGKGE